MMIALVIIVVLVASSSKIIDYYEKSKLEADVELKASLKNMEKLDSYRYQLKSSFTVDTREEVISEVSGERFQKNTHIKGEMVNTPVDIYYIDRIIYNYDSFAAKWLVLDSGTTNSEELLISELNPLSNFRFKSISQVEKLGFENQDSVECLLVKCWPSVESQLLDNLWKDFEYLLWIDFRDDIIRKAVLTANNKNNEKTDLKIQVEFSDFNKKVKIEAPERNTTK